eukprot:3335051-Karenia_brevis.AAC.1
MRCSPNEGKDRPIFKRKKGGVQGPVPEVRYNPRRRRVPYFLLPQVQAFSCWRPFSSPNHPTEYCFA